MADSGAPQALVSADTIHKSLFGKKGKVLNLGHLYFDIVSTARCPVEDFVLRFSYFAGLHIIMLASPKSEQVRKITYEIIKLFLQNEPNFRKSQVNVTVFITTNYEQMDTWSIRKNEPKTNPNEPKTNPILANKTPVRTQFKPKQSQSFDFAQDRFFNYSCICEVDLYNLVLNYGNLTNFYGDYLKWQMHQKPMQ